MSGHVKKKEFAARLSAAADAVAAAEADALLVTPGRDLSYLSGYDAVALERLTCLVVSPHRDPVIVVPELEVLAAKASPLGALGVEVRSWKETDNPHKVVAKAIPKAHKVTVDSHMWAAHVFALQDALPLARFRVDRAVADLRARKSPHEIKAVRDAGAAIDRVHAKVAALLRPGVTERAVAAKIADHIIAEGHATVDFVIVASGPNGASAHHEVSDRELQLGDPVVVDIGGTMPSGYCSDCTRTYSIGAPPEEFLEAYAALRSAQSAAVHHAKVGVSAESVDTAARSILTDAGLGAAFVHRTGHGIGLDTHEEPYIVSGNTHLLEAGNAFSIEPGFYLPGKFGARIEDIVVVTDSETIRCNNESHDLVIAGV